MRLLNRLLGRERSERAGSAAPPSADADADADAIVVASAQVSVAVGGAGQRYTSDRRNLQGAAPEYIAEAAQPSEAAWAHEEELYRQKNANSAEGDQPKPSP